MKIDTAKIENFDSLTPEQKVEALLNLEIEEAKPDYTGYVKKELFDKTASEVAKLKKEAFDRLDEEAKKKAIADEELNNLRARNAELEKDAKVARFKASCLANGYSDELAQKTAEALADGDMDTVFANQQKFLSEHDKKVKADMLGNTPTPPAGSGTTGRTAEDIMKIADDNERIEAIANNLELFN